MKELLNYYFFSTSFLILLMQEVFFVYALNESYCQDKKIIYAPLPQTKKKKKKKPTSTTNTAGIAEISGEPIYRQYKLVSLALALII